MIVIARWYSFYEPVKLLGERNILRNINILNYLVANLL